MASSVGASSGPRRPRRLSSADASSNNPSSPSRWRAVAGRAVSPPPQSSSPCSAERSVRSLKNGSVRETFSVGRRLRRASTDWVRQFVQRGGVETLLDVAKQPPPPPPSVADAARQLQCVLALRAVMDARLGLDFIAQDEECAKKLATALDTPSVAVKKQVVELLSALCVYSSQGLQRALDALAAYQELKKERYRFRFLLDELCRSSSTDYTAALVAFVNCILIATSDFSQRTRLRNEFIGLRILEVLRRLRENDALAEDIRVQLDVFDEQREADDARRQQGGPPGVDLNSTVDVFYAILERVADTPQEIPFLGILQHLLRIDPKEAASDLAWDAAETLVHRATLVESRADRERVLRSPSHRALGPKGSSPGSAASRGPCHCSCHRLDDSRRRSALALSPSALSPTSAHVPPPFPPCAPPPPPPPPPAPPPPMPPTAPAIPTLAPPPPPPPPLPQLTTPKPKSKMRTLNWAKVPTQKVASGKNVWTLLAQTHNGDGGTAVDFSRLEHLFCQRVPQEPGSPRPGHGELNANNTSSNHTVPRRRETAEINLLDGKRSLNVNIFLKQFRSSNEDIVALIVDGNHDDIGADRLRGLLKLLPENDEVEMLRNFDGDHKLLGNAEKFLLQLLKVPSYKLRIEAMLLKEEFAAQLAFLEPTINAMMTAAHDLQKNQSLQEVLYMVLVAGNFLNSGGYAGNAAGFRLTSLQKLTDIRANKPGMNLIHYVAQEAELKNEELLQFTDKMQYLEEAARTSIDQLNTDITALETRVDKITKQMAQEDEDLRQQMVAFLMFSRDELTVLREDMAELERLRVALADFYCEDVASFKLEECFRIFDSFCRKFKMAIEENHRRKTAEEKAEARRRQREEQLAQKRRRISAAPETRPTSMSGSESDTNLVESLLNDIHCGFLQRRESTNSLRLRKSSRTGDDDVSITGSPRVIRRRRESSDDRSPDITPNGTVRRRRNRHPSEENDASLLDFLRQTAENSEGAGGDRLSWGSGDGCGSLDRSLIRRSRRKRPELQQLWGMEDRERPASPAAAMAAPCASHEETTRSQQQTPQRPWQQKIEAWLRTKNELEEEPPRNNLDTLHEDGVNPQKTVNNYQKWKDLDPDSENVETPPTPRREPRAMRGSITSEGSEPPTPTQTTLEPVDDSMGDGSFDRFAATRRTRRFRKPPETSCMDAKTNKTPTVPTTVPVPRRPLNDGVCRDIERVLKDIEKTGHELKTMSLCPNKKADSKQHKVAQRRPSSLPIGEAADSEKVFRSTYTLTPTSPPASADPPQPKRIVRCGSITETTALAPRTGSRRPDAESERDEGFEESQSLVGDGSTSQSASLIRQPSPPMVPVPEHETETNTPSPQKTKSVGNKDEKPVPRSRIPGRTIPVPTTRQYPTTNGHVSPRRVNEKLPPQHMTGSRSSSRSSLASSATSVATIRNKSRFPETRFGYGQNGNARSSLRAPTTLQTRGSTSLATPNRTSSFRQPRPPSKEPPITKLSSLTSNGNFAGNRRADSSQGSISGRTTTTTAPTRQKSTSNQPTLGFMRATMASKAKVPSRGNRTTGTPNHH